MFASWDFINFLTLADFSCEVIKFGFFSGRSLYFLDVQEIFFTFGILKLKVILILLHNFSCFLQD